MRWYEAGERDRKALRRLLALLLALADLAERAGSRSHAVRLFVLWLLGRAEKIARNHVEALTGAVFPAAPAPFLHCDGPAGTSRLALAFRMLAAALAALLVETPSSRGSGAQGACAALAESMVAALAAAPGRRDTS